MQENARNMFSNFTNQKPVEKVSFRRIESVDENEKKQVVSTLGVIPPDSTVIYGGTQKDNMLVFGYYSLDRLPITKSSFFSDLCEITKNINGADPKSVSITSHQFIFHHGCLTKL